MARRIVELLLVVLLSGTMAPLAWGKNAVDTASGEALVSEARNLLEHAEISKASEKQLERIVLTMGARQETAATRALVEALSSRLPQIYVAHDEGGAMIPFVDVGAAARVTLRLWKRNTARDHALHATRDGDTQFLENYFAADAVEQAGILDAIRLSKATDLLLYRDALMERMAEPGGDQLAAAVAERLADIALLQRIIDEGSATVAMNTIRKLTDIVGADAALTLMQTAIDRKDISSATLFEVGRLMPILPAAELLLWSLLQNPHLGGSVAAVLARNADNGTINRLTTLLQADNRLLQQRAALALRLSADPNAMATANAWLTQQSGNEANDE